ncbi:hypothetical protein SALBM311S_03173 [Streptomyces alboniger]
MPAAFHALTTGYAHDRVASTVTLLTEDDTVAVVDPGMVAGPGHPRPARRTRTRRRDQRACLGLFRMTGVIPGGRPGQDGVGRCVPRGWRGRAAVPASSAAAAPRRRVDGFPLFGQGCWAVPGARP